MATYLIIGPSGIGKSTALMHLSEYENVEVFDLDSLLEKEAGKGLTEYVAELGWEGFFKKSKQVIESLKSDKKILLLPWEQVLLKILQVINGISLKILFP